MVYFNQSEWTVVESTDIFVYLEFNADFNTFFGHISATGPVTVHLTSFPI